jgi:PAS domain S-box-containing protein
MSAAQLDFPRTAWSEEDRLSAIDSYDILDTPREEDYDNIVKLAAEICHMPVSMISIVARGKQWFKAGVGVSVREVSLEASICKYAIRQRGLFVVPDTTQDPRFRRNPEVIGNPRYRFYAGVPLETPEGLPLGTLCLLDFKPRVLTEREGFNLKTLAHLVMTQLELRRTLKTKIKSEEELLASELSYRRLFETARDGILILEVETGRITDVNPFLVELLGFSRAEMVGRTVGEISPFKDLVSNQAMLERLQREGYVRYENLPLETRDDRRISVEFVSNIYQAGDKKVIQCNIRDITERKKAEQKLLEKTAFSEAQIHSALDAIIIVDRDGKLLIQNKQMLHLWNPPQDVLNEVDHRRRLEWVARQVKNPGEFTERVEHLYADLHEVSRDEIELINGKIFDRYTAPVLGLDGTYFGRIWAYRDITEQKRNEARFRSLVDSNVQGVLFWNRNGAITGGNDAFLKLIQHTRADLDSGRVRWAAMTPPEYTHLDVRALEEIAANGICAPYEKEFLLEDGSRVPVLIGSAAFKDNPDEGVSFVLNLTERKKLEQQFFRAQRMESIGTLAGGIAHDLNNILAPIMMSIELLKDIADDPQAQEILATIEVSARQGADIVRQVLSFARGLEGERLEIQPKHLLQDLGNILKGTFPKNIRLEFSIPNGLWTLWGDPTHVHQILLNLCVNARDAMPNGGTLTVEIENCVLDEHYASMNSAAKPGRYVQISVTDSGTGIPRSIIDKIFEPFFTTKEMGKGTGLGLSTVMAVIKSHEGFVNVYSEPGKGTTFRVYLPAAEVPAEAQKKLTRRITSPRGNGETVLVIDDEASILTITSQTLQAFGYRVLTASDGAEAVAVYATHANEIAIVLTDMMMPVMDGTATIHALVRINPAIKIVAASGLDASGTVVRVSEPNVKHFLTKPYTAGVLLTTLRAALDEADKT